MAISKRNRRTIEYKGQEFLWWVGNDFDGVGGMLDVNIASLDKTFIVKHFAVHPKTESYLLVIGQYFPGLKTKKGNSVRLTCPDFSDSFVDNAVTPKTIKDILDWCFGQENNNNNLKK